MIEVDRRIDSYDSVCLQHSQIRMLGKEKKRIYSMMAYSYKLHKIRKKKIFRQETGMTSIMYRYV